jgi:hypothetical protein
VVLQDGAFSLALPVHRREQVLGVGFEDDPLGSILRITFGRNLRMKLKRG